MAVASRTRRREGFPRQQGPAKLAEYYARYRAERHDFYRYLGFIASAPR